MRPTRWPLLIFVLSSVSLYVAGQQPGTAISYFHNLPAKLFFFEDTEVALYHDAIEGNVYISENEGKSWTRASDLPEGDSKMVIPHPFNNRYAFVLTKGTTHYRTEDRGKTWRSFDVPARPALVGRPLSFHSDPAKFGYILYQGTKCERSGWGWGQTCDDVTYYTKAAFGDDAQQLLASTSSCSFAHSSTDFKHGADIDLIYCVAFDNSSLSSGGAHSLASSRLYSSSDFFSTKQVENLGIGKNAKGVVAFAIVGKFGVVALKDLATGNNGEMLLYVTVDTVHWAQAKFPHETSARLRENAYTIVESTTHSLAVDVLLQDLSSIGTLFVSNSNGTFFVESLKDTNRNDFGYVDYENVYGVDGIGLANVVSNAQEVEGGVGQKKLKSLITFDDGSSWSAITPPSGSSSCPSGSNISTCSLHLHSVTTPHNFGRIFSSPAPGFVMGVGSIGATLEEYDNSDTFLSTDAGVSWVLAKQGANKYEFGDQGSVMVLVDDEGSTGEMTYSTDYGKTWKSLDLGISFKARILTTISDSTSQKFLLVGQLSRGDTADKGGRFAMVWLDFAALGRRKCQSSDMERWDARKVGGKECLMGHKQWYQRRKASADCYVGEKFEDPVEHEENCTCGDEDFECDYNYVRQSDECVPVGPEQVPFGVCDGTPDQTYMGSSGWRKIPGNTCVGGSEKDKKVAKKCSQAQPEEGQVTHQIFEFPFSVIQHAYFKDSTTILARLTNGQLYQSSNEGYTWSQPVPNENFLSFYHHTYSSDRAYLVTSTSKYYYTTDTGKTWNSLNAPTPPNTFSLQVLHFHPTMSDYLIWSGEKGCSATAAGGGENCHVEAYYSWNNGRDWKLIDTYVRNCAWARDQDLKVDPKQILCESFKDKKGNQRLFSNDINPLQLIGGMDYFKKKTVLFEHVVGFAKFSEYLLVAEYLPSRHSLDLQVSLDGRTFATGLFPPSMHPDTHAYTILESSTDAVFLHMTMTDPPTPYWGNILKSNSNGTYFGLSVDYVNRDERGYVDFEKMIGLDGIALINVVSNPLNATVSGRKTLQSRITHNDGSTWKPLTPPKLDSLGQKYECNSVKCALHVHGYTERWDARATYSSPSVVGVIMAVGSVSETLSPYTESDTFLSRDAGFTWEEVHKDAHLWEFGDSGSILVLVNDEEPTDHVLYTTDEGLTWRTYKFTDKPIRIRSIVTVPSDTSRRFILLGSYPRTSNDVAVHLDFSSLTWKQCVLSLENPGHDDFELWSPSEERAETCLFGRQTVYHRRVRNANCIVGNQEKAKELIVKNCQCTKVDFECEFNYVKDANDNCVLYPGTTPLPDDDSCKNWEDYWYERTAYRKIPFSSCEGDYRPDRGPSHACPGFRSHGFFFWLLVLVLPLGFTTVLAYWYYRKSGLARGTIRLPGDGGPMYTGNSGILATLASVPWFLVGLAGVAWEYTSSTFESLSSGLRSRRGYRDIPVDEDAQILRFEDEE